MNEMRWINTQVRFGEGGRFKASVEPLNEGEPMGLQWVKVADGNDSVVVVLTVDQADELEQQLERGRWHRVFMQRELADKSLAAAEATKEPAEVIVKPADEHSGGWTATFPGHQP